MESHKDYISNNRFHTGFTLIEVLVVISIITILLGATLFFDTNNYRGEAFRAERNSIVIALQKARADSLNNINQETHGVAINPDGYEGYVIFEGSDYASSDSALHARIPATYPVELDPTSPDEIVFAQLSGNADFSGEIVIKDTQRNATTGIVINYEGKIGW